MMCVCRAFKQRPWRGLTRKTITKLQTGLKGTLPKMSGTLAQLLSLTVQRRAYYRGSFQNCRGAVAMSEGDSFVWEKNGWLGRISDKCYDLSLFSPSLFLLGCPLVNSSKEPRSKGGLLSRCNPEKSGSWAQSRVQKVPEWIWWSKFRTWLRVSQRTLS